MSRPRPKHDFLCLNLQQLCIAACSPEPVPVGRPPRFNPLVGLGKSPLQQRRAALAAVVRWRNYIDSRGSLPRLSVLCVYLSVCQSAYSKSIHPSVKSICYINQSIDASIYAYIYIYIYAPEAESSDSSEEDLDVAILIDSFASKDNELRLTSRRLITDT